MEAQQAKYVRDMGLRPSSTAEPEQMAQQLRIKSEEMKQEQTGDNYEGRRPEAETNTLTIDPTFKDILSVLNNRNRVINATHSHSAEGYKQQEIKAETSKNQIRSTSQPPRQNQINKISEKKNKQKSQNQDTDPQATTESDEDTFTNDDQKSPTGNSHVIRKCQHEREWNRGRIRKRGSNKRGQGIMI